MRTVSSQTCHAWPSRKGIVNVEAFFCRCFGLDAREARQERDRAIQQRKEAEEAKRVAEEERDAARKAQEDAEASEAYAKQQADVFQQARIKAEMRQRKAEEQVRKKQRKVQSLQRMLAEIGAESDSDAPPDERAPAFFVNEDGTKVPRPRTRKERMGMAFREAESARYELRLGMARGCLEWEVPIENTQATASVPENSNVCKKALYEVLSGTSTTVVSSLSSVAVDCRSASSRDCVAMAVTFVSLLLLFLDFDYDHLQKSIVRIETVGASFDWFRPFNPRDGLVSLGSGFIVQTEPYILIATNQHVINDALRVQIQLLLHSQAKWDVNIVSACPKFDLALLTLKSDKEFKADLAKAGIQLEALTLSKKVAEMGQDVVALGFPLGQNSLKISKGNVAGNEFVNSNLCIQSTAPISPGNSGGPLLDDAGSEVLGVNFAGATRGENINYVIPAFRVQALVNLHLKEQHGAPWRRLGFRTPGHGLTTVHPNQALAVRKLPEDGVYIGRVRQDGFMSKAQPEIRPGSMLVAVNGKALDGFGKADIKELMLGKERSKCMSCSPLCYYALLEALEADQAALDDLFFIQPDLEAEVSFETCFRGAKHLHKVSTIRTADFDKGIRYVDEPVTEGLPQQYEIFGDIGVMSMTQNHVGEALARTGSPRISRWLLPDKASEPRLMVIYVRPGSYASEVIGEGSAVEKDLCSRQSELKLTHLFIETTGVADPQPFIRVFENEHFAQYFALKAVICVVDLQRVRNILNEPKETFG
eukprot:s4981_g2.t1